MGREVSRPKLGGSIQSYQKENIEIWRKDEPVKIEEECCNKSTTPCTEPSTWSAVRLELMKVNINFIANRSRGISQARVISVPRPTLRTGVIGVEGELRKSISELTMMNDRGLRLMQTSRDG
jgi:hypothetical protein